MKRVALRVVEAEANERQIQLGDALRMERDDMEHTIAVAFDSMLGPDPEFGVDFLAEHLDMNEVVRRLRSALRLAKN